MRVFTVAVAAFAFGMFAQCINASIPESTAAPIYEKPVLYEVATWGELRVWWFETKDTECYVTKNGYSGGISCLRKIQP